MWFCFHNELSQMPFDQIWVDDWVFPVPAYLILCHLVYFKLIWFKNVLFENWQEVLLMLWQYDLSEKLCIPDCLKDLNDVKSLLHFTHSPLELDLQGCLLSLSTNYQRPYPDLDIVIELEHELLQCAYVQVDLVHWYWIDFLIVGYWRVEILYYRSDGTLLRSTFYLLESGGGLINVLVSYHFNLAHESISCWLSDWLHIVGIWCLVVIMLESYLLFWATNLPWGD